MHHREPATDRFCIDTGLRFESRELGFLRVERAAPSGDDVIVEQIALCVTGEEVSVAAERGEGDYSEE